MFKGERWHKGIVGILAVWLALGGLIVAHLTTPRDPVHAAVCWQAEITEQWPDVALAGSVLRVSVQGKPGLPVTIRSLGDFESVGYTGTKPEYGPAVAEFAPLSKGIYFVEPQGLGLVFEVFLDGKHYTRIDFTPLPCAATPTSFPRPTTVAPPPQPTATLRPVVTPTPLPVVPTQPVQPPQSAPLWRGRVVEHRQDLEGRYFATIAVRVIGQPAGHPVQLQTENWSAACTTGTKPEYGPDACEFGALNAGTYRVTPKGLDASLDVVVGLKDFVLVEFYYAGPQPKTRWVGSVVANTSGSEATQHVNSAITVIVSGKPWYEVDIYTDGWSSVAQTGYKPEYGPDACEFGGLRAGTYTIAPKGLGAGVQVTVDGWGWAKVVFTKVAVAPVPQPTPRPTLSVEPTRVVAATPVASPQPTVTPASASWKGWVASNTSGTREGAGVWSVVIVRVLNRGIMPVTISGGGGWSATCLTGTKPEYGPGACEFGGLWPSTYYVRPEGSDTEVEVTMDGLGTAIVEFMAP